MNRLSRLELTQPSTHILLVKHKTIGGARFSSNTMDMLEDAVKPQRDWPLTRPPAIEERCSSYRLFDRL
jgi:hypothetical protein